MPLRHKTFFCCFLAMCLFFRLPGLAAREEDPAGTDPIDRMFFLGESTTTHLRSRGGLPPERVWANESGTMKLDSTLLSRPILTPSGEHLTIEEALKQTQPQILVLSFGLNGITGFVNDKNSYLDPYRKLTSCVFRASPSTRVILQSVYPVARAELQSDWKFSVSPEEINAYITILNEWLSAFCREDPRMKFADTASPLRDGEGYLREEFTTDGIHLTGAAYREILDRLRESEKTE